jgi:ABC-type phosphate transport system substrate-binding protein
MRISRLLFISLLALACAKQETTSTATSGTTAAPSTGGAMVINGAGATFPYPIYSKWFSEYQKLHPNVQINYQSIGSRNCRVPRSRSAARPRTLQLAGSIPQT